MLYGQELSRTGSRSYYFGWGKYDNQKSKLPPTKPYENVVKQVKLSAPLDQVVSLVYGANSRWFEQFMHKIHNDLLCNIQMRSGLETGSKRVYEYSTLSPDGLKRALNKSTETIEHYDLASHVEVLTTTHTSYAESHFTTQTRAVFVSIDSRTTEVRLGTWLLVGITPMKVSANEQLIYCEHFLSELSALKFDNIADFGSDPASEECVLVVKTPVVHEQSNTQTILFHEFGNEVTRAPGLQLYVYVGIASALVGMVLLSMSQVLVAVWRSFTIFALVRSIFDFVLFIDPLRPFVKVRFIFRWRRPRRRPELAILDRLNGQLTLPVCGLNDMFHNMYGVVQIRRHEVLRKARPSHFKRITSRNTGAGEVPLMVVKWSIDVRYWTDEFEFMIRVYNC